MGSHYQGSSDEVRALNAFINLSRAANSLASRHSRRIADEGITLSQFGVLETLHHLGPLAQKDLGGKLLKTSGNITMVVDNLEKQRLVSRRRRADDRRFTTIHLTGKGTALIRKILPKHISEIAKEFSCLSTQEQEELRRLCRILGINNTEE